MCLSVPIKNYLLPASLSLIGLENRAKPKMNDYIEKLKESSERISYNLTQIFKIK
jgi:hypothetical protein